MKIIPKLFALPILLFYISAIAQVRTNFNNDLIILNQGKFIKNYRDLIDFEIPKKNIDSLLEKERRLQEQSPDIKPFRLAEPISIDLNIPKRIDWIIENELAYGKFTIRAIGALSISINFDQFYLPQGTEMYIYNEKGSMITGHITEKENNSNNIWGSWVLKGEIFIIEIKTPDSTKGELLLHSNNIAYGYKEVYRMKVAGFGQSGPCEINVICLLGNGWEPERNSVALLLSDNGSDWCSGAIIMNTCNTNKPFFLTANHCLNPPGSQQQNVAAWRFTFKAWSPTCNPSQNADGVTYNGSTLRANWDGTDFCLVELNTVPSSNSSIHYAGWTTSTTAAQNATCLHHPSGDVMKITRTDNSVSIANFGNSINQHWRADWTPQNNGNGQIVTPVTEGGSSGSPLFDQNHRIVGQLSGGPSYCGGTALRDYYGRFDLSWTGGGTSATRLRDWLDPINSGAMTTNTTNIANLTPYWSPGSFLAMSGSSVVCGSSASYTIPNAPDGSLINWQLTAPVVGGWSYPLPYQNVCTLSATGNNATLTKTGNGTVVLYATITQCDGTQIFASKEVTFGVSQAQGNGAYANSIATLISGTVNFTNVSNNAISMASPTNNQYTFIKTGGSSNAYFTTYSNGNIGFFFSHPTYNNYISFNVQTTNSCGSTNSPVAFYYTGRGNSVTIMPNPASDILNITQNVSDTYSKTARLSKIEIINSSSVQVLISEFPANKYSVSLPISKLSPGIYYLKIFNGISWETYPFVKQ